MTRPVFHKVPTQVPQDLIRDTRLTTTERMIGANLAAYNTSFVRCWPTLEQQGKDVGVSVGTVRKASARLQETGWVTVIPRFLLHDIDGPKDKEVGRLWLIPPGWLRDEHGPALLELYDGSGTLVPIKAECRFADGDGRVRDLSVEGYGVIRQTSNAYQINDVVLPEPTENPEGESEKPLVGTHAHQVARDTCPPVDMSTCPPGSTELINSLTHEIYTPAHIDDRRNDTPAGPEQQALIPGAVEEFAVAFHRVSRHRTPIDELRQSGGNWQRNWLGEAARIIQQTPDDRLDLVKWVCGPNAPRHLYSQCGTPRGFRTRLHLIVDAYQSWQAAQARTAEHRAEQRHAATQRATTERRTTTKPPRIGNWSTAWAQVAGRYSQGGGLTALLSDQTIPRHARIVAWTCGKPALDQHDAKWRYRDAWEATGPDTTNIELPDHIAELIDHPAPTAGDAA